MNKIYSMLLASVLTLAPHLSQADGFSSNLGHSASHASKGLAYTGVAGLQLTSAVAAVPLLVIGHIGKASQHAGDEMISFSNKEFEIGDSTVSRVLPPKEALENNQSN